MTLVALRAATEPVKEEALQAILEDLMCVCVNVCSCAGDGDRMRKTTVYVRKSGDNIRKSESSTNRWRMRTLVELGRIVKDDTLAKFQRNSYAFQSRIS